MASTSAQSPEAEVFRLEGNEHFKQKRFNKAVLCYSKALDIEVTPVLLSNRAQAYLKMESYERALSDSTEALLRDPKLVKALFRRATALEKLQFYGRAQKDLENLLEIEPTNNEARAMLERLKGKIDTPIHEIRCFSKSEPVQSENRLKEITIKTVEKPDPSQLEKINLNQTRDESTA